MRRITWAVVVAVGVGLGGAALADDPKPTTQDTSEATKASAEQASTGEASQAPVEEVRTGAASMEPPDAETPQERQQRLFLENIWNSP